jgi:hypothetical protein
MSQLYGTYCNFCFPIGFSLVHMYELSWQNAMIFSFLVFCFGGLLLEMTWHDNRNTYFLGVENKFDKNSNTSSSFILFIHSFVHSSIHPFINYLTTVQTWVPSFISFILLIIGFIHPFIHYLTKVQTCVPSFISFIHYLTQGSNTCSIFHFIHLFIICKNMFHLSFHSFVHWPRFIHPSIHSFIDLCYPGGTLVATLRLIHNKVIMGVWTSPHLLLDGKS